MSFKAVLKFKRKWAATNYHSQFPSLSSISSVSKRVERGTLVLISAKRCFTGFIQVPYYLYSFVATLLISQNLFANRYFLYDRTKNCLITNFCHKNSTFVHLTEINTVMKRSTMFLDHTHSLQLDKKALSLLLYFGCIQSSFIYY